MHDTRLFGLSKCMERFDRPRAGFVIIVSACVARLLVGLGPFSGKGSPPMHGDFEAQRHWLEITRHLRIKEWYYHDLQWWGLDYPPLTAWHSLLLGAIGTWINPTWFALVLSRTNESSGLKLYMRLTAVFSDVLVLLPALVAYCGLQDQAYVRHGLLLLTALHPALLLIDHGHFQYNGVMLGFMVACLVFAARRRMNLAAACFVACFSFKQMGLYYAPPVFAHLLAHTYRNPRAFVEVATTTIASFAIIWGPFFVYGGADGFQQVIFRIFPLDRGLFEDKVANFWCAFNVIYKVRERFTPATLQRLSLAMTVLSILPSSCWAFARPSTRNFLAAVSASAWGFFLFSFQVHEKSVLVPILPTTMLALWSPEEHWALVSFANDAVLYSLWPLMCKDKLRIQFLIVAALWLFFSLPRRGALLQKTFAPRLLFLFAATTLLLIEPFVSIRGKPDLHVVLNVGVCAAAFLVVFIWLHICIFRRKV
ncbi:Glucosyltransferase-like protein [Savitreella phatthalungensis]